MKSLIFGLLIVVCILQLSEGKGRAPDFESDIKRLKLNLEFLGKSFNVFGSKTHSELNDKVAALRKSYAETLDKEIQSILDEIRTGVDAAKQQGKEAESCFTTADAALKKAREDSKPKEKKCGVESLQMGAAVISFSKHARSSVTDVNRKLETRLRNCSTIKSVPAKNSCYTLVIKEFQQQILDVVKEIQLLRSLVDLATEDTPAIVESCIDEVTHEVKEVAAASKTEATKCVESASAS